MDDGPLLPRARCMHINAKQPLPIQRLLGTPFLIPYKTVINFPAKTIAFYKN
ncbi:hypothetical protein [Siphonobacter sp. SORGH_AS_1065]|uniref:hypothetical protein n=1 Tax=Siphonobacter sp. SORGH_AS_1065 TaxID=3041795 RepID=UPI0027838982|nr:hypothetical protein [Siphonobacter sp. SORGH_AS_1065]MDQ1090562.1 hypothetical protein [Siphonobacter sp. SORGH_AS_1065]